MKTVAEELVHALHTLGVRYAFGIPGGPSIPYMEAMRNQGIEFVTVANEQSAGIMAGVFGRLTGIPGVCHATFGPGATNLSTGVGAALLDRAPLLAFTTEVREEDRSRKVQMNVDHQAIFRPLTKWTARLSKDNFKTTLSQAARVAVAEVPGPVHIGLPVGVEEELLEPGQRIDGYEQAVCPLPDQRMLAKAIGLIEKAKRPLVAVGLTAFRQGIGHRLRAFLDNSNIPVVLTPMAKGLIPESHPCYAGVLFHAQSDIAASIYSQADLVIGIGYDSVEFNYESWMPKAPLIHIDTEPADITPDYAVACEVIGALDASVSFLASARLPAFAWDLARVQTTKAKLFKSLRPKTGTFNPADAIDVIQGIMPQDGILTSDVGAHLHLLGQMWKTEQSSQLMMTNGWSTMGFGIPAAIGAKLCRPASAVACITGDGGFLMNGGELLMARRLGINVAIIVFVDHDYSLIKIKQNWRQVVPYATSVHQGEYFDADKFLGVPVLQAKDTNSLKLSLQTALAASGPVIVETVVDGSVYQELVTRKYK